MSLLNSLLSIFYRRFPSPGHTKQRRSEHELSTSKLKHVIVFKIDSNAFKMHLFSMFNNVLVWIFLQFLLLAMNV